MRTKQNNLKEDILQREEYEQSISESKKLKKRRVQDGDHVTEDSIQAKNLKEDVSTKNSCKTEKPKKEKKTEKNEQAVSKNMKINKRKVQDGDHVTEDSIQADEVKKNVLSKTSNKIEKTKIQKKKDDKAISQKLTENKRKFQEKENVIEDYIVQEIQIKSPDESKAKKRKGEANKQSKSKTPVKKDAGEENQNLPEGWLRKEVVRKSGKTAGQVDIYIYSPEGKKFRSRPDLANYLLKTKSNLKLEQFNFSKKRASDDQVIKDPRKKEKPVPTAETKKAPEKKKLKVSASPKKGCKIAKKVTPKELETDKDKKESGKISKA